MIPLKNRELINTFLSSPMIQNHQKTKELIEVITAQDSVLREKIGELKSLMNSDYLSRDYDLIEGLSQYFNPMHVFLILSHYIEPNKLLKELLSLFRLRGSETVKNILFEVFLKYYNLSTKINYERGEMIIDSTYDLERFIEFYYKNKKYINLEVIGIVKLLARELLVGGHKLQLNYLGALIEAVSIDDTSDELIGVGRTEYSEDLKDYEESISYSPYFQESIGGPTGAGWKLLPGSKEVLNDEFRLDGSELNLFEGKNYLKVDKELPELKIVRVYMPEEVELNIEEDILYPDTTLHKTTISDVAQEDLRGSGGVELEESIESLFDKVFWKVGGERSPGIQEGLINQMSIESLPGQLYEIPNLIPKGERPRRYIQIGLKTNITKSSKIK